MQTIGPEQNDLSTLTVPRLKVFISQLQMKVPSGLKKKQLIMYAEGALMMHQLGIPETTSKKSLELKFTPVRPNPSLDLLGHLLKYGWAVAKVPNYDHVAARNGIFDWLHRVSPSFDPANSETWTRKNIPFNLHGIFEQQGLRPADFASFELAKSCTSATWKRSGRPTRRRHLDRLILSFPN